MPSSIRSRSARLCVEGRVLEKMDPGLAIPARDQFVRSKCFAVEKVRLHCSERLEEVQVLRRAKQRFDIHAQGPQESVGYRAIRSWTVDLQGAAIEQVQAPIAVKLVAPRMAAEVVMIVENEDARAGRGLRPEKMRRRQAADTGADDDQVILFARIPTSSQTLPSRMACATSKEPALEPRIPVHWAGNPPGQQGVGRHPARRCRWQAPMRTAWRPARRRCRPALARPTHAVRRGA